MRHKIAKPLLSVSSEKKRFEGITPGSWPASTAMKPVVPTTVKRKAACITGIQSEQPPLPLTYTVQALQEKKKMNLHRS